MSQLGRTALKAKFESGDTPTQADFIDLIDSVYDFTDDNVNFAFLAKSGTNVSYSTAGTFSLTATAGILLQADVFRLTDLPTSDSGLTTGDVWNDSGTLKIVT